MGIDQYKQKLVMAIALLSSAPVFAASDTTFSAIIGKITTLMTGTGGIMLTLISLLIAVVAFLGHNYKAALGSLGVAVLCSVGPSVANSFFTAVL